MNSMKKIMVVTLAFILCPTFINAASIEVKTAEELRKALETENEIKITKEISASSTGLVIDKDTTIDLNGYTINIINKK